MHQELSACRIDILVRHLQSLHGLVTIMLNSTMTATVDKSPWCMLVQHCSTCKTSCLCARKCRELCRIASAFLQRLTHIGKKMRAMLDEVGSKANAMLREHKKAGNLFTIAPASQPRSAAAARGAEPYAATGTPNGWAGSTAIALEPMSAAMMALSLLSNTNYLIDQGLHSLTLPRLPLMYPDDRAAQDRCMARVDGV